MEDNLLRSFSGPLIDNWEYLKDIPPHRLGQLNYEYFSKRRLSIYCDMSLTTNPPAMAIACAYVTGGSVHVEAKRVNETDNIKSVYGEMLAVVFALENFNKYLFEETEYIKIHSDCSIIERASENLIPFENKPQLKAFQEEFSSLFSTTKEYYPTKRIAINYLSRKGKNPFHSCAHNSSRKLIIKKKEVSHTWDLF